VKIDRNKKSFQQGECIMKKHLLLGCVVGLAAMMLMGCGSASKYYDENAASNIIAETSATKSEEMGMSMQEHAEMDYAEGADISSAEGQNVSQVTNRKLIKTVSMDVETEEFDSFINSLQTRITGLGGYVENSSTNGNSYYSNRGRYANYTIRIPAEKLDELMGNVAELANVTWKNESIQDVTLQYVDAESHKIALQTEQERLLELMEKADTVEDLIAIESRLSEIRYYIQNYESTLRIYDNQVNYSTLSLNVTEVKKLTPQEERNVWERIRDGFTENLENIAVGIQNFFIGVIVAIPYLIIWGILLFLAYKIFKKVIQRAIQKRKNKKQPDVAEAHKVQDDTKEK